MRTRAFIFLWLGFSACCFSESLLAGDRSLVYVAGPLFNKDEKHAEEEIAGILERHGFRTFLPQRDGFEEIKIRQSIKSLFNVSDERLADLISEVIYSLDIYQVIERCGSYVGNMNGVVMDDGAVAELVYAAMSGHPAIFYRDDSRSEFNGAMNPLVIQSANIVVNRSDDIPHALTKLNQELPEFKVTLPPTVQAKVDRGKALWQALEQIRAQFSEPKDQTQKLAEQINIIFGV